MELLNAHSEAPPPKWELNALRPGLHVRLHTDAGAVLWVRCTTKQRIDGSYSGEIEHSTAADIPRGVPVQFKKRNVFAVA
jgi:hypothetical protein